MADPSAEPSVSDLSVTEQELHGTLVQRVQRRIELIEAELGAKIRTALIPELTSLVPATVATHLEALAVKFLPLATWQEFRAELDAKLAEWSAAAFNSLEERMIGVVRHELELFKAAHPVLSADLASLTAEAPTPPSAVIGHQSLEAIQAMVDSQAPPAPNDSGDHNVDESASLWEAEQTLDVFPTLEAFVAQGFYADTYDFQKAAFEARKNPAPSVESPSPASPGENGPTDPAAGAPAASV